jgi:ribose/xylose/arabinose/galactoside ABC-type transport system permease subunit
MFALLILLIIVFSFSAPRFFTVGTLNVIASQAAVLLVVAIGGTFVILMGMIDLSVGMTLSFAGVMVAYLIPHLGVPGAVVCALILGMVVGLMNGFFVTAARLPSFLVTLGTMSVIDGLALTWGATYKTFESGALDWISNGNFLGGFPNLMVWALIFWAILCFVQFRTRFGRYAYAIGGGEAVSKLSGIPVGRYKLAAFALAGLMAAVAGVLLAGRMLAGTEQMGGGYMLNSIAAICIGGTALSGGVGGIHRTLLGAIIISTLTVGLNITKVGPNWQTMITGFVLIVAVYFTMDRSRSVIVK